MYSEGNNLSSFYTNCKEKNYMGTTTQHWLRYLATPVLLLGAVALAQATSANYPTRPIRVVVTVSPGAGGDTMAHAVGRIMGESFGQSVVIDNRAGGSGLIATELVAQAAPDGYTLNIG